MKLALLTAGMVGFGTFALLSLGFELGRTYERARMTAPGVTISCTTNYGCLDSNASKRPTP